MRSKRLMACICNIFFGGVVCMVIISVVGGCLIVILQWFWICSKEEMKKEKKEKQEEKEKREKVEN